MWFIFNDSPLPLDMWAAVSGSSGPFPWITFYKSLSLRHNAVCSLNNIIFFWVWWGYWTTLLTSWGIIIWSEWVTTMSCCQSSSWTLCSCSCDVPDIAVVEHYLGSSYDYLWFTFCSNSKYQCVVLVLHQAKNVLY